MTRGVLSDNSLNASSINYSLLNAKTKGPAGLSEAQIPDIANGEEQIIQKLQ